MGGCGKMIQDMVEDRTRFRALTVATAMVMYLLLVSDILTYTKIETDTTIAKLEKSSTLPAFGYLGEALVHAPAVETLLASGDAIEGRTVTAAILEVFVTDLSGTVDCSTSAVAKRHGTARGLRLAGVCDTALSGASNTTSEQGDARFTQLIFPSGPPGLYTVRFDTAADDMDAVNEPLDASIKLLSTVLHLKPLGPAPPDVTIGPSGWPTWAQPEVLVLSDEWMPLAGKKVTIFSWPWPEFETTEAKHHIVGQHLALLEGNTAISDAEGIASFSSLHITTATSPFTYLMLYCEGVVVSWNSESITGERPIQDAPAAKAYVPPILIAPSKPDATGRQEEWEVLIHDAVLLSESIDSSLDGYDCTGEAINEAKWCGEDFNKTRATCPAGCKFNKPLSVQEGAALPATAIKVAVKRPATCTGEPSDPSSEWGCSEYLAERLRIEKICKGKWAKCQKNNVDNLTIYQQFGESCPAGCAYTPSGGVPNQRVVAVLASANGMFLPRFFETGGEGEGDPNHKQLLNPVSVVTDAAGIATFDDLRFTTYGAAGLYRLAFAAGGQVSTDVSRAIDVSTSVAEVRILSRGGILLDLQGATPASQVPGTSEVLLRYPQTLTVLVLNGHGEPVAGKKVSVHLVDSTDTLIYGATLVVDVKAAQDQGMSVVSGDDGIATFPVKWLSLPTGVADPDCIEGTTPAGCTAAGFRANVDGVASKLRVAGGVPIPTAYSPRHEALELNDRGKITLTCDVSNLDPRVVHHGDTLKLGSAMAFAAGRATVDGRTEIKAYPLPSSPPWAGQEGSAGGLVSCGGTADDEDATPDCGEAFAESVGAICPAGCTSHILGQPTFVELPEVSYGCQQLQVTGLNFEKKVQAVLADFADDDEELTSRCIITEHDTFTALTPNNTPLQLCTANSELSGAANNCLHISVTEVTTLHDSAAPQRVPYFDENLRRLCFAGMTGTFSFKFDAWTTDPGDPACSSDVIHIAWVGQTAFLSLDYADPRSGDHYADFRHHPFSPSQTHKLNTEADLHTASDSVWLPIFNAAAAAAADPYTDLYFPKPDNFNVLEMIFYDSAYEQVFPNDIGDATVELVGEPANVAPVDFTDPVVYSRRGARKDWRAFIYEWGVIEFRTIVSSVNCLETATGDNSDPVDKNACDAVVGDDLADERVCEAVTMNSNSEEPACSYPSYTFCGLNICYRHFIAVIPRKGYAGEIAFVVISEGATSPVVRISVENPVASLDIVSHMADDDGRVGMPLSTLPAVQIKDADGTELEGYSVMVSLTATTLDDDSLAPSTAARAALDEIFELEPPEELQGSRSRSSAQFDMSMSTLENTMVIEGGCKAMLDVADSSTSAGNPCDPDQDSYANFIPNSQIGKGANPACGLRERCCPADSNHPACPAGRCAPMFPESRGFRSSCRSDTAGVAKFPSLTPIAGDPKGCYRPRYFYAPFRKTEFEEYQYMGLNLRNRVLSEYGATICFVNKDNNKIVTAPSTTLIEGTSGFSVAPTVRVSRPYHSEWLDPLPPSNNYAFLTALPVTIENSVKSFDVPAIAMNRFARKKFSKTTCVIFGGQGVVGDCNLQTNSYYGLATVEDGPETLWLHEIQTRPQLRQAAPGEKMQLKFCDGGGIFGGTGACSDLTQTITVTNQATAVILLNEPPLNIRLSDVIEMRVSVTANGSPMQMTDVQAEIVHAHGVSQTPVEFLMKAFLSVKGDSSCISPEHAKAVVDQAIAIDLGEIIETSSTRRHLAENTCSVLYCDACSDETSCDGVTQGACEWDATAGECQFAFINEDVVKTLKENMISQLSELAGVTTQDSIDCLQGAAKDYITGYKAKLDATRARGTTDANGIASFSLAVSMGMTGNYAIQFSSGKASVTTKSFTVINSIQEVEFTTFDGLPSSGCNGWRLYDDTSATNCGTKAQYPLMVELPPISLRALDLSDSYVPRVSDLAIQLFVSDKVAQKQLTFDEIIAEAKNTGSSDDSTASDKAQKAIDLIIQGAKLLQPPSKTTTSANAYLVAGTVDDPGLATSDFVPAFDSSTGVYTYTGVKMVVAKPGEYTIRSTFFGVESGPAANSVVVEMIATDNWEYQVMMWLQRFILFGIFASVFLGNDAYDNNGKFDWTIMLSIAVVVVIGVWINIQYYEQNWDSKLTYIVLLADLILIVILLVVVLAGTLVGKSHFQHVEQRRTAFYKYCHRMFNERRDLSWYHGRLAEAIVEEAAIIARKEIKTTSKLIASLEKKSGSKGESTSLDGNRHDQLLSYRSYVGLCEEIIRRAESAKESPHTVARGVHVHVPQFLKRSKDVFETAHTYATEQLQQRGVSAELLSTFVKETAALSDLQGVPPSMFDLRETRVVQLFEQARTAAIAKRTKYVPQIKEILKDTHAFYFPARIFISFALSAVTYALCMTRLILKFEAYRDSIGNAQSKTKTQIFHFLSKMESLYFDRFGGELTNEAIEYAYAQVDAVVYLFDELLDAFQLAFMLAMTIVSLIFVYTQVQIFLDLRSQVLLARLGVKTTATRMAHKIKGFDSLNFIGVSVANTTLVLHMLIFIFFLILFPLCWPMSYRLIGAGLSSITSGIFVVLVPIVIKILSKKYALNRSYSKSQSGRPAGSRMIANRKCFGCYDLWSLFLACVTGFGSAVVRIVLWVVIGLISLLGITESPMPAWFERYTQLDTGSKSFNAMIMQTIYHNNPIVNVFAWELMDLAGLGLRGPDGASASYSAGAKTAEELRKLRLRNRWQVAYTLVRNPLARAERAGNYIKVATTEAAVEDSTAIGIEVEVEETQMKETVTSSETGSTESIDLAKSKLQQRAQERRDRKRHDPAPGQDGATADIVVDDLDGDNPTAGAPKGSPAVAKSGEKLGV